MIGDGVSEGYPFKHNHEDALFIVTDGKLKVTRDNTLLLVITRRVTRKLENLSCKVLEDGSEVDYTSNASCSHEIVVEG